MRSTSSSESRSSNPPGPAPRRSSGALAQWSRRNAAGSPAQRWIAGMLLVDAVAIGAVGAVGVDAVAVGAVGAVGVLGVGHGGRRRRVGALGVFAPGGDDVLVLDAGGAVAHGRPPQAWLLGQLRYTRDALAKHPSQVRAATTSR